jgi:hypothetical protein
MFVILSERGPRRSLQPGGGESKDLLLYLLLYLFVILSESKDLLFTLTEQIYSNRRIAIGFRHG